MEERLSQLYWFFDGLLILSLLWVAWRALVNPDLFKSIVLFISFGLLLALAWVRLQAPDVALAEAAIGSAGGFGGKPTDTETFFSFTSYATPTSIYRYDLASDEVEQIRTPDVDFNPANYEVRQQRRQPR